MEVANNEVIKSGIVAKEKRFGIAASAKAFEILSSGLYSDKVKSVIRELSCNALDSHVMVGKGDVPFEVHLPSFVEPYFKITDFGLGINEEDIYEVYTVYFASTKTQSNDQIGCLGLGSKSFFAYLNKGNAVVESTFNGEIKTYSAFIDEQGEPSIVLMNVEKTDNPNGLSVQFPVKTCDIDNFRNKAAEVYKYFKVKPIIK
jgi:DNA topoisomerase VI subunit B